MTAIGLSLFFVSVSILCLKHPPTTWDFMNWWRRQWSRQVPPIPPTNDEKTDTPIESQDREQKHDTSTRIRGSSSAKSQSTEMQFNIEKPTLMPPPPLPLKRSQDNSCAPTISPPEEHDLEYKPVFPAVNSAQRASGRVDPPTLGVAPTPRQPPLRSIHEPPSSKPTSSLMPPPSGPIPNRRPASSSSSSLLAPTTTSAPTRSKKILLSPGHSPLDWAQHLANTPPHLLSGLPPGVPFIRVPPALLAHHNGRKDPKTGLKKDAWTALGGKVYNISPYLKYHPGGQGELLRCAGKDGTKLFAEVHPWVSWEGMLEPGCLVGMAVKDG